jgi:U3 small nucleolar RNA-associated protein 10
MSALVVQQLLGPVVSQLLVDAPPGLDNSEDENEHEKIATLDEMDDTVVSCVSQMALSSGSDLFWKPLNREVRLRIEYLFKTPSLFISKTCLCLCLI